MAIRKRPFDVVLYHHYCSFAFASLGQGPVAAVIKMVTTNEEMLRCGPALEA